MNKKLNGVKYRICILLYMSAVHLSLANDRKSGAFFFLCAACNERLYRSDTGPVAGGCWCMRMFDNGLGLGQASRHANPSTTAGPESVWLGPDRTAHARFRMYVIDPRPRVGPQTTCARCVAVS